MWGDDYQKDDEEISAGFADIAHTGLKIVGTVAALAVMAAIVMVYSA